MARPIKQGLEYYPNDVDIHDDDKVALISSEFNAIGEAILWRLLCKIYKNGYYYSWGGDECLLFCRWAGGIFVPGQVDEVVKGCLRRSIFDNRVFEMFGILTSTGIQKRYLQATTERKEVEINSQFWLLEIPESNRFKVIQPINEVKPPINEVNRQKSTQSKVKESKEENIYMKFYENQIKLSKNDSKYSFFVEYIFGKNELQAELSGILSIKNQLTFEQFNKLLDKAKLNGMKLMDIVLKIENDKKYWKDKKSLYQTMNNWIENRFVK